MIALFFLAMMLGLWIALVAMLEWDWLYGIADLSTAEVVFGEGAERWLAGGFGGALLLIGVIGMCTS
jgi:hypothetical protein